MADTTPFYVDRAKTGRASCKGCKSSCPSGELRLAKVVASPYGENQQMKSWHHVDCFLNALLKQRPTTKRIDSIDDIGNWESLSKEDQEYLIKKINETEKLYAEKNNGKYTAKVIKNESNISKTPRSSAQSKEDIPNTNIKIEDNMFSTFHTLCKKISRVDAYTDKTATVNIFFTKGSDDISFKGDLALWCRFLLPQVSKRIYNLKSKQLVKLFSKIFNTDHDDMLTHLEQGDVANTIKHFFSESKTIQPANESTLTIHEVDQFLEDLSKLTKEEEQIYHFRKIVKKCTKGDIVMLIRLIKGDLRINAGPKHILEGIHPDAYSVFQTSRDLDMVLDRVLSDSAGVKHKDAAHNNVRAKIVLMTPVLPMLAEACKSVEMAMKKCPNGMFSEIKYDGERVQVHKRGTEFKYFSRALKPVLPHKVNHFKDYLPQAFPKGVDLILDAEVLMVDVNTGKPLPFGTLGIHKQSEFKDAQVCLFIFDCLYYNDKVLIDLPIKKRRQILIDNMVEVKNHVMLSEQKLIEKPADLAKMIAEVLQLGLEGLVLKDLESPYEPGKRHWLKVKKDYLFDGAMADTADLVVLGAWFGTGKKGGMMSVFLMGCYNKQRNKWLTVTKVHTGHDDSTLERLQKELSPLMLKISQDYSKLPSWIDCNKGMVPDFIAKNPKDQPVWEITGTEITKANIHTADGISVRFPRVTRIRDDKNWETATSFEELRQLYKTSKEKTDVSLLNKLAEASTTDSYEPPKRKLKNSPKVNKIDNFLKNETSSIKNRKTELDRSSLIDSDDEKYSKDDIDFKEEIQSSPKNEGIVPFHKTKKKKSEDMSNELDEPPKKKIKESFKNTIDSFIQKKNVSIKKEKLDIDLDFDDESKLHVNTNDSMDSQGDKTTEHLKHTSKKLKRERKSDKSEESPKKKIKNSPKSNKIEYFVKKNNPTIKEEKCDMDILISAGRSNSSMSVDESHIEKDVNIQLFPENPFPDTFKDKRLGFYPDFISFSGEEQSHFERHWIAYGGIVVKAIKQMDVDYVVHNDDRIGFREMQKLKKKVREDTRHANKDWLYKCIKYVKLFDPKKFPVFVEP